MVYDPSNDDVYVADQVPDMVSVISVTTVVGSVVVGVNPTALAYDPSDGEVYVADYGSLGIPGEILIVSGMNAIGEIGLRHPSR